jgi:hypothetical protein
MLVQAFNEESYLERLTGLDKLYEESEAAIAGADWGEEGGNSDEDDFWVAEVESGRSVWLNLGWGWNRPSESQSRIEGGVYSIRKMLQVGRVVGLMVL